MSDDPREDLARQLLHSTAVERLDPAPGTFEHLTVAGARRRSHRRLVSAGAMATVVAFVVGLVVVATHGPNHDSTLQPGGRMDNFLAESTKGRLHIAATIPLHLPTTGPIVGAEAPDGAFFYAPQSQRDSFGRVRPGTPGTNIVRVIDGTSTPTIAEHAPGPVIGLGADAIDLYVATPTKVIRYSRKTGDEIHVWPLLHSPVSTAQIVLAGRWMYVSAGFQCDACGANPNTLLSINLVTGKRRVSATDVSPTGIAGDELHAFYVGWNGGLIRVTPTGHSIRSRAPVDQFSPVVGEFSRGIAVYAGGPAPGNLAKIEVFDPRRLHLSGHWLTRGAVSPYGVVPSVTGGAFSSDSTCPPGQAVAFCSRDGALGTTVSRLNIATGSRSSSVRIPHIVFLFGPAPAVVTAAGGSYQLVRIK